MKTLAFAIFAIFLLHPLHAEELVMRTLRVKHTLPDIYTNQTLPKVDGKDIQFSPLFYGSLPADEVKKYADFSSAKEWSDGHKLEFPGGAIGKVDAAQADKGDGIAWDAIIKIDGPQADLTTQVTVYSDGGALVFRFFDEQSNQTEYVLMQFKGKSITLE